MRHCHLLTLLACCLLFTTCKKNNSGDGKATISDLTTMLNIQQAAGLQYEASWSASQDTLKAIFDMAQWLSRQPEVAHVFLPDDYNVVIHYRSGLRSSISVKYTGDNNSHLMRDGDGSYKTGSINTYVLGGHGKNATLDDKLIGNKKIMVFLPFESEFYLYAPGGQYPYLPLFDQSKTKVEVTLVKNSAATFSVFKTIQDYGFIILDTHGDGDGSFSMYTGAEELDIPAHPQAERWTQAQVQEYITKMGSDVLELLLSGKIYLTNYTLVDLFNSSKPISMGVKLSVGDEYVREMPKLKDAVVFGNHCYSGNTAQFMFDDKPSGQLPDAWLQAGAVAYYGYAFRDGSSQPVLNDFCVRMEDSIIINLVVNGDSTGTAHLAGDAAEQCYESNRRKRDLTRAEEITGATVMAVAVPRSSLVYDSMYLKLFHSPRYKYGCGTYTDARDGEVYQLACFGSKKWFAENLRYNAPGSVIAYNDPTKLKEFGRLYDYPTVSAGGGVSAHNQPGKVRGICPQGWHIPNYYDWQQLVSAVNAASPEQLAIRLKSKSALWTGDNTLNDSLRNASGFNAEPAGSAQQTGSSGTITYNKNAYTQIWMSSTDHPDPDDAGYILLSAPVTGFPGLSTNGFLPAAPASTDVNFFNSCRCVED